jgi:hypothetical protein
MVYHSFQVSQHRSHINSISYSMTHHQFLDGQENLQMWKVLALYGRGDNLVPAALPQERDLVSGVQEAGWAPGIVCKSVDNLTLPGAWAVELYT